MTSLQTILLFICLWKQGASFCPIGCSCKVLKSNRAEANCSSLGLVSIPESSKKQIQHYKYLDLSSNSFKQLDKDVFKSKHFTTIEKLILSNCQIQDVHEDAVKSIQGLSTLDLSNNEIVNLFPTTFQGLDQLNHLVLSNNPIQTISDTLFANSNLETLELNHCNFNGIKENAFKDLKKLTELSLVGNDVTKIEVKSLESLVALQSLNINTNSWKCDCKLKPFVEWALRNENVFRNKTLTCTKTDKIKTNLNAQSMSVLVCQPVIVYPLGSNVVEYQESVVLNCSATGDPVPVFKWYEETSLLNPPSMSIDGTLAFSIQRDSKWSNLTVKRQTSSEIRNLTLFCKAVSGVGNDTRAFHLVDTSAESLNRYDLNWKLTFKIVLLSSILLVLIGCLIYATFSVCFHKNSKNSANTTSYEINELNDLENDGNILSTLPLNLQLDNVSKSTNSVSENESISLHGYSFDEVDSKAQREINQSSKTEVEDTSNFDEKNVSTKRDWMLEDEACEESWVELDLSVQEEYVSPSPRFI